MEKTMMGPTRKFIEEVQRIRRDKETLLALVRGGYEQPKEMSQEDAIKRLIADIEECDEVIAEALQDDTRIDLECRSRFFT